MYRIVLIMFPALICGMVLTSCGKAADVDEYKIEGVYIGTYTQTNLARGFSWTSTPTIELKEGEYTFKDDYGIFRVTDEGDYSISNHKIIFEVKNATMDPPMEIMYVPGYAIYSFSGEYDYKYNGDKLILTRVVNLSEDMIKCEFVFNIQ